jgi:hypothetical protein
MEGDTLIRLFAEIVRDCDELGTFQFELCIGFLWVLRQLLFTNEKY